MFDGSTLYKETKGSPITGYMLLKSRGSNFPPAWIERYAETRKKMHGDVAKAMKEGFTGFCPVFDALLLPVKEFAHHAAPGIL